MRRPSVPAWLTPGPALERTADGAVLLALGLVGIVGSTRHVLDLARTHGADGFPIPDSPGLGSWLVSLVWETLAAYSGWEMRRRTGWARVVPGITLLASVAFVVLANLEAAGLPVLTDDAWRYIIAVSPAAVFLAVAALVETRAWKRPGRAAKARAATPAPKAQPVERPAAPPATKPAAAPAESPRRVATPPARLAIAPKRTEPVARAPRGASTTALLDALPDDGQTITRKDWMTTSGVTSNDTFKSAVATLVSRGVITRVSDGVYQRAAAQPEAVAR